MCQARCQALECESGPGCWEGGSGRGNVALGLSNAAPSHPRHTSPPSGETQSWYVLGDVPPGPVPMRGFLAKHCHTTCKESESNKQRRDDRGHRRS